MAEEDVRRVADALRVSPQEVEGVLRQLTTEGVGDSQDKTVMVERHSTGWRLRRGTKEDRRCGPTRRDKSTAEEDVRRVADALRVSPQEVEGVLRELTTEGVGDSQDKTVTVERHSTGWRLRCGTKQDRHYGPTRRDKSMAEEDVRRVADALRVSPQEVERVLQQLTTEGVGDSQDQDCHGGAT